MEESTQCKKCCNNQPCEQKSAETEGNCGETFDEAYSFGSESSHAPDHSLNDQGCKAGGDYYDFRIFLCHVTILTPFCYHVILAYFLLIDKNGRYIL